VPDCHLINPLHLLENSDPGGSKRPRMRGASAGNSKFEIDRSAQVSFFNNLAKFEKKSACS
jgi:hypothetical protein